MARRTPKRSGLWPGTTSRSAWVETTPSTSTTGKMGPTATMATTPSTAATATTLSTRPGSTDPIESPDTPPVDYSYGESGNDTIDAVDGNVDHIDCGETNKGNKDSDTVYYDVE